jgi:hypothetical protein
LRVRQGVIIDVGNLKNRQSGELKLQNFYTKLRKKRLTASKD